MAQTEEFLGTGRRKRAIARVRLADGSGKVTVNGHDVEDYFTVENQRSIAIEPLETVDLNEKTDVRVNVTGGGMAGQAGAVRLGIKGNCVLYACRLAQTPRTTKEIADMFGIQSKDISVHVNMAKDAYTKIKSEDSLGVL